MRTRFMPAGVCAIAILGAAAVEAASDTPGRYVMKDLAEGFLRLDTQTGAVSRCRPKGQGWACEALPDDRTALQEEISRLEKENAALKARLSQLEAAGKEDKKIEIPDDAELNRLMTFIEKLMRRFADFAKSLQQKPADPI
jgi:hypothetical protein